MPDDNIVGTFPPAPTRGGNPNAVYRDDSDEPSAAPSPATSSDPDTSEPGTPQQPGDGDEPQQDQHPQQPPADEVPFHQHPRWQERQRELDQLRREKEQLLELARMATERSQPVQPSAPAAPDPWEGKINHPDPATAQWYREQRDLLHREAERIADSKVAKVQRDLELGRQELLALKVAQFRSENKEFAPGSELEQRMIPLLKQGVDIEIARKLVLFDQLEAENRTLKGKQQAVSKKVAANVEATAGIPAASGMPGRKGDWRDRVSEEYDRGGDVIDIANAAFGGRRRRG